MLRYVREDTHYLLYIYDLMKRKLLSSSTDPNYPEASLVELYQKEILTENSYLNIYGLYDADLNGQQLGIFANGVAFVPVAKKIVEDDYLTCMKIVKEIHEHN
ncbi:hypothetical protein Hanom_Chr10g00879671 [Helianthus anomalus]